MGNPGVFQGYPYLCSRVQVRVFLQNHTLMAQTTCLASFGPFFVCVGLCWPLLAVIGYSMATVGLCGPVLAFVGCRWLLWVFVGLCWPLLAFVGHCWLLCNKNKMKI